MDFNEKNKYDLAICQAFLRHLSQPEQALEKMIQSVKNEGLVVSIETNRPFEEISTRVEGYKYEPWHRLNHLSKLWTCELESGERDYSIGLKLPLLMQELGLKDVDIRINDKVNFISYKQEENHYDKALKQYFFSKGWHQSKTKSDSKTADLLRNRGLSHEEVKAYIESQEGFRAYLESNKHQLSLLSSYGTLVSYGYKR